MWSALVICNFGILVPIIVLPWTCVSMLTIWLITTGAAANRLVTRFVAVMAYNCLAMVLAAIVALTVAITSSVDHVVVACRIVPRYDRCRSNHRCSDGHGYRRSVNRHRRPEGGPRLILHPNPPPLAYRLGFRLGRPGIRVVFRSLS